MQFYTSKMSSFRNALFCVLSISLALKVNGDATFAGSSVSSDSSGTRSVLVTGRNGAGGSIQTRFGGGGPVVAGGPIGGPPGTFASAGGASAYAGPGGAYAGPGGAYAGPWGFPYWNDGGAYASASAGAPYPAYPYNYPAPYPYDPYYDNNYGNGVGVYSGNDGNGIQTRIANIPPGGQATIVEQTGNDAPKVYTYRGPASTSTKEVVAKIV